MMLTRRTLFGIAIVPLVFGAKEFITPLPLCEPKKFREYHTISYFTEFFPTFVKSIDDVPLSARKAILATHEKGNPGFYEMDISSGYDKYDDYFWVRASSRAKL